VKQTGWESGCQLIPHFRILIVSVVKIYKQCLQTALASVGLFPRPPSGAFAPGFHWVPEVLGYSPHMKIRDGATGAQSRYKSGTAGNWTNELSITSPTSQGIHRHTTCRYLVLLIVGTTCFVILAFQRRTQPILQIRAVWVLCMRDCDDVCRVTWVSPGQTLLTDQCWAYRVVPRRVASYSKCSTSRCYSAPRSSSSVCPACSRWLVSGQWSVVSGRCFHISHRFTVWLIAALCQ